ncbi:MAG TPA: BTAD domain-containing putative transcriptional regulator [Methylobacter sp.]|jgi:DNA-binding SARP family transcriptional activator
MALLAYLAIETRPHFRERLAEIFWPDMPVESGRHNLRQAVLQLRRLFDSLNVSSSVLLVSRDTLSVNADYFQIDADEFINASLLTESPSLEQIHNWEHLAGHYRGGPFLDGIEFENASESESWLYIKRETFHRHALGLLEQLSDYHEHHGDKAKALLFANRYLELESWNEEMHRKVMRLLAMNGQTGAALAQFDACRRMLREELERMPDTETIGLVESIKAGKLRHEPNQKPAGISVVTWSNALCSINQAIIRCWWIPTTRTQASMSGRSCRGRSGFWVFPNKPER